MRILRIFFTHPSAIMGYIYGKILAVFLGATKALNVKVDWISLAEKRNGKVPLESRRYSNSNCFLQQSTRFIMLEISIKKVRWQPNRLYEVTFRIYSKFDGRLLNEQRFDCLTKSKARRFHVWQEWGWSDPGFWDPGDYELQLLLDRVDVFKICFTIEPPPWKMPAEVLHQPLVRFYPVVSGTPLKETRQYNIRFPYQTTHKLICELMVHNQLYEQSDRTYAVTAQCYTDDEKLLWEDHHDWLVRAQEQEPLNSWELQVPGRWSPGIYRVDILIDGLDFAWGAFAIEA